MKEIRILIICAALSLAILTVFTDVGPETRPTFSGLDPGSEMTIDCTVIGSRPSKNGTILSMIDHSGSEASVYCPDRTLKETIPSGTTVRLVAISSEEDPRFLFATSIAILSNE